MTTIEIKIELLRQGKTISGLAREFGCLREELSMCIRKVRIYPRLRRLLAAELGISEEQLFGNQAKQAKVA
jgi:lambda repressor-like predicted transcriptional regulator